MTGPSPFLSWQNSPIWGIINILQKTVWIYYKNGFQEHLIATKKAETVENERHPHEQKIFIEGTVQIDIPNKEGVEVDIKK